MSRAPIRSTLRALLHMRPLFPVLATVRRARHLMLKAQNAGGRHYCPICESAIRMFYPHGDPPRPDERCPVCRSLQRHRMDWVFLKRRTDLFDGNPKDMLHVAPEAGLSLRYQSIPGVHYISADLKSPRAMVRTDLTRIAFPSNTFSVIYCSHVLEHIPDDRAALAELFRVLRPGGWALLQVPVIADRTFEDPAVTDPVERKKVFGQHDHVRKCGPDYIERIREAGFEARSYPASEVVTEEEGQRMGIRRTRPIFYCIKAAGLGPAIAPREDA